VGVRQTLSTVPIFRAELPSLRMKRHVASYFRVVATGRARTRRKKAFFSLSTLLLFSPTLQCLEPPSPTPFSPENSSPIPILEVAGKAPGLELDPELLHRLPRSKVESPATDHDPASVYEGVLLRDLLSHAGVPEGAAIRGEYVSWIVILEASDGYRAVFSLAELDPAVGTGGVLLADGRDGNALSSGDGPLRLIVPGEKRHARWIRQITRITVGPVKAPTGAK
jgi:hypothetical protein